MDLEISITHSNHQLIIRCLNGTTELDTNMKNIELLNRFMTIAFTLATSLFLTTGCLEESEFEKQMKESDLKIQNYLKTNKENAKQADNGIYYKMLKQNGSGQRPEPGEVMSVKYEIWTLSGKLLESKTEEPTLLKFGWNHIIPNGFNHGLDIIRKGEKIRCFLPSYLAYNSYQGQDLFGPNTNFIIEIELIDILSEEEVFKQEIDKIEEFVKQGQLQGVTTTSSGLYFKSYKSEPLNSDKAKIYHTAKIHYERKYLDGTLIQKTEDDKPLTVRLDTRQLVDGFREGILKMQEGEKALLIMPSEIAFGASVKVIPEAIRKDLWEDGYIGSLVDAYSPVYYEVELVELK